MKLLKAVFFENFLLFLMYGLLKLRYNMIKETQDATPNLFGNLSLALDRNHFF